MFQTRLLFAALREIFSVFVVFVIFPYCANRIVVGIVTGQVECREKLAAGLAAPAVTYFDRSSKPRFTSPVRPGIVRGAKRSSAGDRIAGAQHNYLSGRM